MNNAKKVYYDGSIVIDFLETSLNNLLQQRDLKNTISGTYPLLMEKSDFERKHLTYKIFSGSSEGPCHLTPQGG